MRADDLTDARVYGHQMERIGKIDHIFIDDVTGNPKWVSVKVGAILGRKYVVPVENAVTSKGDLLIPYSKTCVKNSPEFKDNFSPQLEEELRVHYNIETPVKLDVPPVDPPVDPNAEPPRSRKPLSTAKRPAPKPSNKHEK